MKAAWNVFGKSYEYRMKYNAYKEDRMRKEKEAKKNVDGQLGIEDFIGGEML